MRTVRLMHALFLGGLVLLDTILAVVFKNVGFGGVNFISSFAFIGLLLFQQTDSNPELIVKILFVSTWLELNHVDSFPIFIASYLLTFLIMGIIKTLVGNEIQEFYILVILALSLKELITYILLISLKNLDMSLMTFIVQRSFWVIMGSLVMIPFVVSLNKKMHRRILQKAQNTYMR